MNNFLEKKIEMDVQGQAHVVSIATHMKDLPDGSCVQEEVWRRIEDRDQGLLNRRLIQRDIATGVAVSEAVYSNKNWPDTYIARHRETGAVTEYNGEKISEFNPPLKPLLGFEPQASRPKPRKAPARSRKHGHGS